MKRVFLFVLTNIAVLAIITVVTSLLGVDRFLTGNGLNLGMLLAFSAIVGFTGSIFSLMISKWMAKMAYNIQIITTPSTEEERWLQKTVERLTHDADIAMPELGIYDSPEANAFATGPSRSNSLVAVSTGLLAAMDRKSAEAVLAHEVSHVANGDMVTMTLLQGVLNTFVIFLSRVAAYFIDNALRKDNDDSGPGIGYFVASLVCQIVLSILASIVVMAFSRHREYKADAGAARLSGKENMISALQALQRASEAVGIDDRSQSLATCKISGHTGGLMALFSTHPPVEKRIEALRSL